MNQLPVLVVFGDKTANEIIEAAQACAAEKFSAIEKLYFAEEQFTQQDVPRLTALGTQVHFHVGIANDRLKQQVVQACEARGWRAYSIVHPTAVISPSATLAPGVFVGPLAVISSHANVGRHALIHLHASIGHDAYIGDFAAILPGARISGNVRIGSRTLVGSNAFVTAGKNIGDDCRIDALTYVNQDLPEFHMLSPRFAKAVRRVKE